MKPVAPSTPDLATRFHQAVAELDALLAGAAGRLTDENVEGELHRWLDGDDEPLP